MIAATPDHDHRSRQPPDDVAHHPGGSLRSTPPRTSEPTPPAAVALRPRPTGGFHCFDLFARSRLLHVPVLREPLLLGHRRPAVRRARDLRGDDRQQVVAVRHEEHRHVRLEVGGLDLDRPSGRSNRIIRCLVNSTN